MDQFKVLQFPRDHHVRASTGRKPNTEGSAVQPFLLKAFSKIRERSEGILPRNFQLLTAGRDTSPKAAATDGPPTASTTASTEVSSISPLYSRNVNTSSLHGMAVELIGVLGSIPAMAVALKTLSSRLKSTRDALGVSAADLCRAINCKPNRWSQYESGDRAITLPVAIRLCEVYGLTLDWIYRADAAGLPVHLHRKIATIAA